MSGQTVRTLTQPFNASGDLSINNSGEVFAVDFGESYQNPHGMNIYRILSDGSVDLFFGGVLSASGSAFDAQNNLYVSNFISSAGVVSKITPNGQITFFSAGNAFPTGIAVDDSGNVFVASCGGSRIVKFDSNGVDTQYFTSNLFSCALGVTFDDAGNLYATNRDDGNVTRILPDGTVGLFATISGNGNGHITFSNGHLFVAARSIHQIFKIDLSGGVELLAGTGVRGLDDGPALQATFSLPNGIVASPSGDTLYVNDVVPLVGDTLHPNIVRMIILNDNPNGISNAAERIADGFVLHQNYPNPFNPSTNIQYDLRRSTKVVLRIYDNLGQEVRTLVDATQPAGVHQIQWDGTNEEGVEVPSGLYLYYLKAGSSIQARKMILLR
jgi:sugar lactone lactonase YvrE